MNKLTLSLAHFLIGAAACSGGVATVQDVQTTADANTSADTVENISDMAPTGDGLVDAVRFAAARLESIERGSSWEC